MVSQIQKTSLRPLLRQVELLLGDGHTHGGTANLANFGKNLTTTQLGGIAANETIRLLAQRYSYEHSLLHMAMYHNWHASEECDGNCKDLCNELYGDSSVHGPLECPKLDSSVTSARACCEAMCEGCQSSMTGHRGSPLTWLLRLRFAANRLFFIAIAYRGSNETAHNIVKAEARLGAALPGPLSATLMEDYTNLTYHIPPSKWSHLDRAPLFDMGNIPTKYVSNLVQQWTVNTCRSKMPNREGVVIAEPGRNKKTCPRALRFNELERVVSHEYGKSGPLKHCTFEFYFDKTEGGILRRTASSWFGSSDGSES